MSLNLTPAIATLKVSTHPEPETAPVKIRTLLVIKALSVWQPPEGVTFTIEIDPALKLVAVRMVACCVVFLMPIDLSRSCWEVLKALDRAALIVLEEKRRKHEAEPADPILAKASEDFEAAIQKDVRRN